jgi:hypothetical protein
MKSEAMRSENCPLSIKKDKQTPVGTGVLFIFQGNRENILLKQHLLIWSIIGSERIKRMEGAV